MNTNLDELAVQWRDERPDLDVQALAVSTFVTRLGDLFELEFRSVCQTVAELGPGDGRVLFALRRNGADSPMRPTDLFRSLLITSGAVTKQVDRLIERGLVERKPDPNYKRGRLIGLTEEGRKTADDLIGLMFSPQSRIGGAFAKLSGDQKSFGLRFVRTLYETLEMAVLANDDMADTAATNPKKKRAVELAG